MKDKEHTLVTVEDIFHLVTEKNKANFLHDFHGIVEAWIVFKKLMRKNKIPKSQWGSKEFKWIDDGKHNISIELNPNQ